MGRDRDTPLLRQWLLIKTLSARRYGATVGELAAELDVAEKTIRRDLRTFAQAGFPLEESTGPHGRKSWRLAQANGRPELSFAIDEALALYLGRRLLEPLAGTILWDAAQRAFRKIRASLGAPALRYLEKMADRMHQTTLGAGDYSQKAELIDQLMMAVEDRKATMILYRSLRATEPVEYEIHPYGLVYHRGSLYVVAFSRDHNEVRHFKIDRVESASVTEFPFRMPDDFQLTNHLTGSFGIYQGHSEVQVKIRFAPTVARYVEEGTWHKSQKLTRQKDQSLIAEFRLSDSEEIKRWILSFGQHAEVLEPAALREEMRREVGVLREMYGNSDRRRARSTTLKPTYKGSP